MVARLSNREGNSFHLFQWYRGNEAVGLRFRKLLELIKKFFIISSQISVYILSTKKKIYGNHVRVAALEVN